MNVWSLITAPWAITPSVYEIILEVGARYLAGEKLSRDQVAARIQDKRQRQPAHDSSNVAVIDLCGVIAKRMNMFDDISGGTSTEQLRNDFRGALDDPGVDAIMLFIDSPGGAVEGTQEMAREILAARGRKPIVAFSDGMICSAAYYLASAADEIYISGDNVAVGSIGVVTTHIDRSKMEEMIGRKTTEIYAGKYKRIDSGWAPLSKEGRQVLQAEVDHIYSAFVNDVAAHRGVTPEECLASMADGRVFLGQKAVEAGLVDGIRTFDEVLSDLSSRGPAPNYQRRRRAEKEEDPMPDPTPKPAPTPAPPAPALSPGEQAVQDTLNALTARLESMERTSAEDKKLISQLQQQLADSDAKRREADIDLLLKALEAEGKSTPAARDSTRDFLLSLTPEQLEKWTAAKKAEAPQVVFKDLGHREKTRPGGSASGDQEEERQLQALLDAAPHDLGQVSRDSDHQG